MYSSVCTSLKYISIDAILIESVIFINCINFEQYIVQCINFITASLKRNFSRSENYRQICTFFSRKNVREATPDTMIHRNVSFMRKLSLDARLPVARIV